MRGGSHQLEPNRRASCEAPWACPSKTGFPATGPGIDVGSMWGRWGDDVESMWNLCPEPDRLLVWLAYRGDHVH